MKFGASYNCWVTLLDKTYQEHGVGMYQEVGSTDEGSEFQYISDDYNALTKHILEENSGMELVTDHPYMGGEVDVMIGGGTVVAVLVEPGCDGIYGIVFSDPVVLGPEVIK